MVFISFLNIDSLRIFNSGNFLLFLCLIVTLICSNVEDVARDAGSIDVDEDMFLRKCKQIYLSLNFRSLSDYS